MSDFLVESSRRSIDLILHSSGLQRLDESGYSLCLEVSLNASMRNHYWQQISPQSHLLAYLNIFSLLPFAYSKCAHCWKPRRRCVMLEQHAALSSLGNTAETLLHCSACHLAYYCSAECQSAHWRVHKYFCKCVRPHFARIAPWFECARSFLSQSAITVFSRKPCLSLLQSFLSLSTEPIFKSVSSAPVPEHALLNVNDSFYRAFSWSCNFAQSLTLLSSAQRFALKRAILASHQIDRK